MSVVVAGEALMDLAPRGELLLPLPGGSPYNVAVGLRRLGIDCAYLGRISTDGFGQRLRARLRDEDVSLHYLVETPDPTTLAVVHLDDQARATYAFYLEGTSATGLGTADLDALPRLPEGSALHVSFGALTLEDPAGESLVALLESTAGRVRSLDPNVRANVITDLPGYGQRLDDLVATCDLVKVSDEDLMTLYPDADPVEVAQRWSSSGPVLVVVTRGPQGAVAVGRDGRHCSTRGIDVEVADTVGAGDAFTAGLLAWLDRAGHLGDRDALSALPVSATVDALAHAVRVSAITCTRPGADPPTTAQVDAASG